MTGPGRSPSTPWVQPVQGVSRDIRSPQSFHPTLSPQATGMRSNGSITEISSPNYFGMTVEHRSSNPPTSTPGPHVQKNWTGSFPHPQASLPSPTKLQLFSRESVSDGLVNLLRSESESDKGRRESASQGFPFNGDRSSGWSQGNLSGSTPEYRKPSLGKWSECAQIFPRYPTPCKNQT
jgi:protein-tyrosine phosphatase